jgi:hypothetical protein
MDDLEQQLASVRAQAEQARQRQARAEAERHQAQGSLAAADQTLRDEFPELVSQNPESLLDALRQQAEAEVSNVLKALAAAEGAV